MTSPIIMILNLHESTYGMSGTSESGVFYWIPTETRSLLRSFVTSFIAAHRCTLHVQIKLCDGSGESGGMVEMAEERFRRSVPPAQEAFLPAPRSLSIICLLFSGS